MIAAVTGRRGAGGVLARVATTHRRGQETLGPESMSAGGGGDHVGRYVRRACCARCSHRADLAEEAYRVNFADVVCLRAAYGFRARKWRTIAQKARSACVRQAGAHEIEFLTVRDGYARERYKHAADAHRGRPEATAPCREAPRGSKAVSRAIDPHSASTDAQVGKLVARRSTHLRFRLAGAPMRYEGKRD